MPANGSCSSVHRSSIANYCQCCAANGGSRKNPVSPGTDKHGLYLAANYERVDRYLVVPRIGLLDSCHEAASRANNEQFKVNDPEVRATNVLTSESDPIQQALRRIQTFVCVASCIMSFYFASSVGIALATVATLNMLSGTSRSARGSG